MQKEYLEDLKRKISSLNEEESLKRNLYLKDLALGKISGPLTGYPEIDKVWLRYYDNDAIKGNIPEKRVYDVIYDNNRKHLSDTALLYYGRKISFGEFFDNIKKAAQAFINFGIKEGDSVSIIMPSTPETFYAFYALNRLGVTANMIDPRYNEDKIKHLINDTNSKMVIVINVSEDKIENIRPYLTTKNIISVSPTLSLPLVLNLGLQAIELFKGKKDSNKSNFMTWEDFIEYRGNKPVIDAKYDPDFPAAIVYTGGTTGPSKGAIMTTKCLNAIAYHQKSSMPLVKRKDKYLNIMPPFIAFGLTCGINNPLSVGAVVDLIPNFNHQEFAQLLNKHKPKHVIGVPSFWLSLTDSKYAMDRDFSYLRSIIAGGCGINPEEEKRVNKFLTQHGCQYKLSKGYGLTEVSSCASFTSCDLNNKLGSVGIPLVKDNFKIVDPETKEEKMYGESGEIYITGPSIMGGYLNNEAQTKAMIHTDDFGTKWVETGDIGSIDKDGCIFIEDRIKNMIIRPDGFKVYPLTIENIILQHPGIYTCKVVGGSKPEYSMGKFPVAYIVIKDEYKLKTEDIIKEVNNLCLKNLPEYQVPIDFIIKDSLPYTSIGKVDTKSLESEYNQRDNNISLKRKL